MVGKGDVVAEMGIGFIVSILIILANGWKETITALIAVIIMFQSSSYWRMVGKVGCWG